MDLARWWNSGKQLGSAGASVVRRGFPRTHPFSQARSVIAIASQRCDQLLSRNDVVTLWRLPEDLEDRFSPLGHLPRLPLRLVLILRSGRSNSSWRCDCHDHRARARHQRRGPGVPCAQCRTGGPGAECWQILHGAAQTTRSLGSGSGRASGVSPISLPCTISMRRRLPRPAGLLDRRSPPTLGELANAAGISAFHFHRVFKAIAGVTPKAYATATARSGFAKISKGATP